MLIILAWIALALFLLAITCMTAPVRLRYDSDDKRLRATWLGLSYTRHFGTKEPRQQKPEATPTRSRQPTARRLWQDRDLVAQVCRELWTALKALCRVATFQGTEASVSLPDPMWTGVVSGLLAAVRVDQLRLSANFENVNYARIRVRFRPYQFLWILAAAAMRLPCVRILRTVRSIRKQQHTGRVHCSSKGDLPCLRTQRASSAS